MTEIDLIQRKLNSYLVQEGYYDSGFYRKNFYSLKYNVISEKDEFKLNNFKGAYYDIDSNELTYISNSKCDEIITNEFIHMITANREIKNIGYSKSHEFEQFNKAATEWLKLRCLNLNLDCANEELLEIVILFDELVEKYGEYAMFSHFFKADYDSFLKKFDLKQIKYISNIINAMNDIIAKKKAKTKTITKQFEILL